MKRTPLVLLHGFPFSPAMWEAQIPALSRECPVLAPALVNFSGSESGTKDLDGFAIAILEDLDRQGYERAIFLGLSMGGYVAFRILAIAPQRVAGLILVDTKAAPDGEESKARRINQIARIESERSVSWMSDAMIPGLLAKTTIENQPDIVSKVVGWIRSAAPQSVINALRAMAGRPDSTPLLTKISVPTLVVVGENDALTPVSEMAGIAEAIVGAQFVVLPDVGHLSAIEDVDGFNTVVARFIQESPVD